MEWSTENKTIQIENFKQEIKLLLIGNYELGYRKSVKTISTSLVIPNYQKSYARNKIKNLFNPKPSETKQMSIHTVMKE